MYEQITKINMKACLVSILEWRTCSSLDIYDVLNNFSYFRYIFGFLEYQI